MRVYELRAGRIYAETTPERLTGVGLGLTLWRGVFEQKEGLWLRWQDAEGSLIPTGAERAEQERQHAEREHQRAERLVAQLRALGVEPEGDPGFDREA